MVHASGAQGSVAFVFGDDPALARPGAGPAAVSLLLPDGSTLPVPLGGLSVVWCLFDARLTGRTTLDACNLSAFAVVGRAFACFGPAGARGQLTINGSRLEVDVPGEGSHDPTVVEHEGIAVVVCSSEQIDATQGARQRLMSYSRHGRARLPSMTSLHDRIPNSRCVRLIVRRATSAGMNGPA